MKQILIVEASPRQDDSVSRKITRKLEERLRAAYPQARFVHRDLSQTPLPHLDAAALSAMSAKDGAATLSDRLVGELLDSDAVVISTPMWNFGLPSALKAWIDHVVRAGKTFSYSEKGPVGLAAGKKAFVVASSGGVYSSGPMQAFDFVLPYLERVLNFIGIQDVQAIRVEGVAIPTLAAQALEQGRKAAEAVAL